MTFLSFSDILKLSTHEWYEAALAPDSPYHIKDIEQMLATARQLIDGGFITKEDLEKILQNPNAKEKILALREIIIKGAIEQEKKRDAVNLKAVLEENEKRMEDEAAARLQNQGTSKEEAKKIIDIINKYKLTPLQKSDLLKQVADHPLEALRTAAASQPVLEVVKLVSVIKYPPIENTKAAVEAHLGSNNKLLVDSVTAFKLINPEAKPVEIETFILSIQAKIEAEGELATYNSQGLEQISKFKVATGDSELVVQTFATQLFKSNPHLTFQEAVSVSQELQDNSIHEFAAQVQLQMRSDFSTRNITPDQLSVNNDVYRVALEHFRPDLKFSFDKGFDFRTMFQSQRIAFNNSQLIVPIRQSPPFRLFYGYVQKIESLNPLTKDAMSFVFQRMGLPPLSGTASQQLYNRTGGRIAARVAQSTIGKAAIRTGTRFLLKTVGKEATKKIIQAIGGSATGGLLAVAIEVGDFILNLPIVRDVKNWIVDNAKKLIKNGANGAMIVAGGGAAAIAAALGGGIAAITGAGIAGAGSVAVMQGVMTGSGAAVGMLQGVGTFVGSVSSMLVEVAVVSIATPIIVTIIATPIVVALLLFIINSSAYVLPKSLNYTIDMSSIVPLGSGMDFPHCFPVRGVITQGPKGPSCSSHCSGEELNANAIDIGASGIDRILPVPVRATHNGTVTRTGYDYTGYGKHVVIESKDGTFSTIYGHLDTILVSSGPVQAGTTIGFMGNTGQSTGKHLHYGLKSDAHASILGSVPSIQLNASISDTDLNSCYANNK